MYLTRSTRLRAAKTIGALFLFIITAGFASTALAQNCSPVHITLSSQSEIDDFQADHGPCTNVLGNLTILESVSGNITSLGGLSGLTTIGLNLNIQQNASLPDLDGLSGLTTIGGRLFVFDNALLNNLDGLAGISALNRLWLADNASLADIDGLSGVSGTMSGELVIKNHAALMNLNGLSGITGVGTQLAIDNNDSLTGLDGLSGIASVGTTLSIQDNASLTSLNSLSSLTSVGGFLRILRNDSLVTLGSNLSGLTSVGGFLNIKDNALLTSLNDLSGLTSVNGDLTIWGNASLTSLDGLGGITSVSGNLSIQENDLLPGLDELSSLASVDGYLYIIGNDSLTGLGGLSSLTSVGDYLSIQSNLALTDFDGGLALLIWVGTDVLIQNNPLLGSCGDLQALLDDIDDGDPGPGPGGAGIPDVGGDLSLSGNQWFCNSRDAILGRAEAIASVQVTKVFSDGLEDEVDVTLTCNTGLPLENTFTIAGGDPTGVTFVVTSFVNGELSCKVTESGGPAGYTLEDTDGDGCELVDSGGGFYSCRMNNVADPAVFTVTKEWEIIGSGGDSTPEEAKVTIYCDAFISKGRESRIDGVWEISRVLGDGESVTATVDTIQHPATCWVKETVFDSSVESDTSDCGRRVLTAGSTSSCTIVNSVFFEGIPTLDRYGLAMLVLLMLGAGVIGLGRRT